jgi:tol-pal system protein YbgF
MKIPGKASGKQVLGVMIDGAEMKIAQLGWEKGELALFGIESVILPARLGKIGTSTSHHPVEGIIGEESDIFGIEDEDLEPDPILDEEPEEEAEQQDLSGTLINVFSKYSLNNNKIAVNVPEGQASYYSFESEFGLKGKKLEKRIREEINPLAGGTLDTATINHFKTDSDGMMVVVSEGNVPIIEELIDIKNYLSTGIPYFCHAGSNEIALVNLVRMAIDPPEDQISAVVYIGSDFSRIIIMKGHTPISFIQAIREGYQSPGVCQTLFSKILLEQEEAGIPDIDQIILAGEIGIPRAVEFFEKQFPDTEIKPITPGPLDTSMLKAEEIALFPNFAIPVALAWEALDRKNSKWIHTDLMPHNVKDAQRTFKVAWHGIMLLGMIFLGVVLLSYQGFTTLGRIKSLEDSIRVKKASNAALQSDLIYIEQLQHKVNMNKSNLEFLNSIIGDPDKWGRLFDKLSVDFERVKRIWIEQIESSGDGFTLVGKALSRDRVPELAGSFDAADLQRVTRVISESGEIAYEFEFMANLPPPPPEISKEKAVTTDQAASVGGRIEAGQEGSNNPKRIELPPDDQTKKSAANNQNNNRKAAIAQARPQQKVARQDVQKEQQPIAPQRDNTDRNASKLTQTQGPSVQEVNAAADQVRPKQNIQKQSQPVAVKGDDADRNLPKVPQGNAQSVSKKDSRKPSMGIESASSLYDRGIKSVRNREIDKALVAFNSIIKNHSGTPEAAAAQYWIGECHYSNKDFQKAADAFEKNLEHTSNPKRPAAMVMLGMSYIKLGKKDAAREHFEALIEAYPEGEFTETAKRKLDALGG